LGLFEKLFPKKTETQKVEGYFRTLNAYSPSFSTYYGGVYEMELTRAAIHCFANACGKLKPEVVGSAYRHLERVLQYKPNPWMDTTKFLYRLATILAVNNTAFILPLYAEDFETIIGYYPLLPQNVEVVEYMGEPYLRYSFRNGQKAAIEMSRVGILTQHQYNDDFFGNSNAALDPTMQLLDIQKQGMEEGIKQSAMIRFIARLAGSLRSEDITKERNRFSTENLSSDNKSGVMMFDSKYEDVKQIDSKPFIVDADQMKIIQTNVYNYFGVNEKILQNSYDENEWNAFYEGKIEPFALQVGLVLTNMTFTSKALGYGNEILLSSNRLQYASNTTKLQISSQMFDRGILTVNQVMDIWNLPHVEDGDKRYIRKEYTEVSKLGEGGNGNANQDTGQGIQSNIDPAQDTGQPGEEDRQ